MCKTVPKLNNIGYILNIYPLERLEKPILIFNMIFMYSLEYIGMI
ncbi:hypothetical protein EZS27_001253 [termite gut metagenome]|uniref:Uncharacterized protein n=1 Tax=termite gut metagenome TaxID=433724 RepID=A0A5J4SZI9_9ZZZZ